MKEGKMKMEPKDYLKEPYARILVPVDDGTYFAEILEFPGCFAQGDTPNEAMENLENVAIDWIQSAIELDQQIPPPNMNVSYSGRFALRLPKSIHRRAAQFAEKDNTSLNQFLLSAIASRVGAEDFTNRLIESIEEKLRPIGRTILIISDESLQRWDESRMTLTALPYFDQHLLEKSKVSNIPEKILEVSKNA